MVVDGPKMYPPCFVMSIFCIRVGVHHHVGSFCIPATRLSGEKERQGFQMRKFKTAEENRTNYIYYFNDGSKCVITPGEDGENTTIIAQLHAMDDEQVDADRHEEYHRQVHYLAYSDGEGEDADDRNPYLCDTAADPLEQMLASINEQEHSEKLDKLKAALTTLTDLQKETIYKKYYRNMSNVDIAAEEGVSEAAIRNRLKKIFANLAKKI